VKSPTSEIPGVLPPSETSRFTVDGLQPQVAVEPKSGEEIGDLLRLAGSQNWGIVPFGAGTKQGMGNSLRRFDVALSLANFNRVPEYQPEDLVVKVESGCRLVDLQRTLAPDNLFLPIDPPYYNESTLGGIVASNASGPWRFAHGTMRDFLLGISVVQPDGTRTKFGARVVKNVTGYDMCKLYVGSFGTLGILTDFYFKLKPLPPCEKTVLVVLKGLSEVGLALDQLFSSPLTPLAVELLNPAALAVLNQSISLTDSKEGYSLVVRFGEVETAVKWQVEQLEKLWGPLCAKGIILGDIVEQNLLWEVLREDRPYLNGFQGSVIKLKINGKSNQLVELTQRLESFKEKMEGQVFVKSHAGSGVIRAFFHFATSPVQEQRMVTCVQELRSHLRPSRGSVIVESLPLALKEAIDVWGYHSKDKSLMQRIKNEYDPQGRLNPGRFVV